jgi:hypothetical protein
MGYGNKRGKKGIKDAKTGLAGDEMRRAKLISWINGKDRGTINSYLFEYIIDDA